MKRSWLILYEITYCDKFGNDERKESRWDVVDSIEEARQSVAELQEAHHDSGRCYGSSVTCKIVRVTEESLT